MEEVPFCCNACCRTVKGVFSQVLYFSLEVCFRSWVSWLGAYFWVNCKGFQYINITIMLSGYYNFVSYENELKDEEAWGKRVTLLYHKVMLSVLKAIVNILWIHCLVILLVALEFRWVSGRCLSKWYSCTCFMCCLLLCDRYPSREFHLLTGGLQSRIISGYCYW